MLIVPGFGFLCNVFFYHTKIYYKQKQATIEKGVNFAQNAATLCIKKLVIIEHNSRNSKEIPVMEF